MITRCPHCQCCSKVNSALVGRSFICPDCKRAFEVAPPAQCPNCAAEMEPNDILCITCGYHLEEKAVVAPPFVPDPEPPAPVVPLHHRLLITLVEWLPGLFRPLHLVMFVLFEAIAVGVALLALGVLSAGLFFETLYIGSFSVVIHAQATAFLFLPNLQTLKTAFMDIEGEAWWAYLGVVFLPLGVIVGIMCFIGSRLPAT